MTDEEIKKAKDQFVRVAMKLGVDISPAVKLWEFAFATGQRAGGDTIAEITNDGLSKVRALLTSSPFILLLFSLSACSDAKSSARAEAERVFVDQPGYVCFLIRDESAKAIGGNCLRE